VKKVFEKGFDQLCKNSTSMLCLHKVNHGNSPFYCATRQLVTLSRVGLVKYQGKSLFGTGSGKSGERKMRAYFKAICHKKPERMGLYLKEAMGVKTF
jgi:hypothetical protein